MCIASRIMLSTCCLPLLASSLATAEIIDFEDVATPVLNPNFGDIGAVSNGYRGFNWGTNWPGGDSEPIPPGSGTVYHNNGTANSGYLTAIAAGTRAMFTPTSYDGFHQLTVSRSEAWDFVAADIAAAWRTGMLVQFTGSLAGNQLYSYSVTLNSAGVLYAMNLNFQGIDTLTIRSSGGTNVYVGGGGAHLIIDNFAYTVPAPSAMALLAAAGFCRRRRR
ncbi:MAG: hypothetical protein RL591_2156 [Planctomycetota bacterium]|jgi:hypothetical protein